MFMMMNMTVVSFIYLCLYHIFKTNRNDHSRNTLFLMAQLVLLWIIFSLMLNLKLTRKLVCADQDGVVRGLTVRDPNGRLRRVVFSEPHFVLGYKGCFAHVDVQTSHRRLVLNIQYSMANFYYWVGSLKSPPQVKIYSYVSLFFERCWDVWKFSAIQRVLWDGAYCNKVHPKVRNLSAHQKEVIAGLSAPEPIGCPGDFWIESKPSEISNVSCKWSMSMCHTKIWSALFHLFWTR